MRKFSSSVTITDPLVKYQSLLSTGLYSPDPAQHRLAIHLQKIYHRLKDYSPSIEYQTRLKAIRRALEQSKGEDRSKSLAVESHPIRRNPLFARFFARTEGPDTLSLTRVLTSHEEAISIDSPQGLFLSGEVGTGKSMLLDLLAEGLPTSRKRRWHFNTFMLYTLSQLEHHRKTHARMQADEQQYSLLWMAKEMIERSPILFLDEFQLPDKAASKILSNLFTAFFQLGGVLVASSNRMPEELERAAGFDYSSSTAAGGGVLGQLLGLRKNRGRGELYGASSDFAAFLEVLKARCEFWQMEGGKDWRRREADELPNVYDSTLSVPTTTQYSPAAVSTDGSSNAVEAAQSSGMVKTPRYYHLHSTDEARWSQSLDDLLPPSVKQTPWESTTLTVYGRTITIPQQHNGIVHWDFADLVSAFGPADYITMASTFHTFIIDGIPVLTVTQKNEARRLITLLDALYEARCKLVVRASAGPDDLFFPEAKRGGGGGGAVLPSSMSPSRAAAGVVDADALHSETIAEAYQDARSPFRPNISSYDDESSFSLSSPKRNTTYDPDHEFGADHPSGVGRGQSDNNSNGKRQGQSGVDFSNTTAFTGEDERFAYRRAASRLWELCGARWHARPGDAAEWWRPLPPEARHWERGSSSSAAAASKPAASTTPARDPRRGEEHMGPAVQLDELAGLQKLRVEHLRRAAEGQRMRAR